MLETYVLFRRLSLGDGRNAKCRILLKILTADTWY